MSHDYESRSRMSEQQLKESIRSHLSDPDEFREHNEERRTYDYEILMHEMNILEYRVAGRKVLFLLNKMREYIVDEDWDNAFKVKRTIISTVKDVVWHGREGTQPGHVFTIGDVTKGRSLSIPVPPGPEGPTNEYS